MTATAPALASATFAIEGMRCASCAGRVADAIRAVPGVEEATVNLVTGTALARGALDAGSVERAVSAAGFGARVLAEPLPLEVQRAREEADRRARRSRLVLALAGTAVAMAAMPFGHADTAWVQLVASTPVVFWAGAEFFAGAWRAAWARAANMDTLVALGSGAAWARSAVAVAVGDHALYFEVAAAIVALVLLGRSLEERARHRARDALRALADLSPPIALVRVGGQDVARALADVLVGDTVVVRPGSRVAVDGVVLDGLSSVDASLLTGESEPVPIAPGDAVFGGTLNGNGALLVRATRIGADAALAHITRLVAEAQAKKARVQRLADAVSARFVPFVLVAAALTAAGWAAVVGPEAAFLPAVAVLVVACPCALGLATPTALLVGSGRAATAGIVVRDVAALERAASLDTLVLDKTGTLTEGRPTVTDVLVLDGSDPDAVLRLAAAVERRSEHPLAGAVVAAAQALGPLPEVVDFRSAPGQGVSAVVDGREVRVGQADWISSVGVDASPFEAPSESLRAKGLTILLVSVSGRAAAVFGVVDPIRAGAAEAVGRLRAAGVRLVLATGDHAAAAGRVAAALGIDEVHAGVRPGEKAALVRRLQAAGARVGMLGDGVNDAPALAAADVGFAVGTGTDVAQQVASLTLLGGDLRRVATAISLSRATLRVVRQNLFWAFAYNILALPVAAAGLLSPVIASGLMACSSVSVVGNALRLRHVEL